MSNLEWAQLEQKAERQGVSIPFQDHFVFKMASLLALLPVQDPNIAFRLYPCKQPMGH